MFFSFVTKMSLLYYFTVWISLIVFYFKQNVATLFILMSLECVQKTEREKERKENIYKQKTQMAKTWSTLAIQERLAFVFAPD